MFDVDKKVPSAPMAGNDMERPTPITITDKKTNRSYVLDFTRDSVRFAENQGFELGEVGKFMASQVPLLFHYAFRANHKGMSRQKTDELFETWDAFPVVILQRLMELYNYTLVSMYDTDTKNSDGDNLKNATLDIQM